MLKYILVLQWSATSESDFNVLTPMEDLLEAGLPNVHGLVDGHDFGGGEMNIFVQTDRPLEAFQDAMTLLGTNPRWVDVRVAYRPADGDRYVVIWPKTLEVFSVS